MMMFLTLSKSNDGRRWERDVGFSFSCVFSCGLAVKERSPASGEKKRRKNREKAGQRNRGAQGVLTGKQHRVHCEH